MTAVGRFILGVIAAELVSVSWPIAALVCAEPDAIRWIANSTTFGIHHHSAMSIAFGLFAAIFCKDVFGPTLTYPRVYRFGSIAILAVLICATIGVALVDAQGNAMPPCYIRNDAERRRAYQIEIALRAIDDPTKLNEQAAKVYHDQKAEYMRLIGSDEGAAKMKRANSLGFISVAINIVFGCFIATFFFYVAAGTIRKRLGSSVNSVDALIVIYAALGLWFPLRTYASWYESSIWNQNWLQAYGAVIVMFIAYLVTGVFLYMRYTESPISPWLLATITALFPALGLIKILKPEILTWMAKSIQLLHWFYFLVIWFVILLFLFVIALQTLLPTTPARPDPSLEDT